MNLLAGETFLERMILMKKNGKFMVAGTGGALFLLLIALVRFVDVEKVGPQGTAVGLSYLNKSVFERLGVNMLWYNITDWLGILAIAAAFAFAVMGFVQLIKRKSLLKVDKEILALGILYIAIIGLYVLFEQVIVNYRPIIMPGCTKPEASFPSSHTMLVYTIMGSTALILGKYVKNDKLCRAMQTVCVIIIAVTVIGRLISGVHWFTDILGALLISTTFLALFSKAVE